MGALWVVTFFMVVPFAVVQGRTYALNITFVDGKQPFTELPFFAFGAHGVTEVQVGAPCTTSVVFALAKTDRSTSNHRVTAQIKTQQYECSGGHEPGSSSSGGSDDAEAAWQVDSLSTPRLSPASNTTTATITITDPGYYALIVYRCAAPGEAASVVVPIVVTQYNVAEATTLPEPEEASSLHYGDDYVAALYLAMFSLHIGFALMWLRKLRHHGPTLVTQNEKLLHTSLSSLVVVTSINLEMRWLATYDQLRTSTGQSPFALGAEFTQVCLTALMLACLGLLGISLRRILSGASIVQTVIHVASRWLRDVWLPFDLLVSMMDVGCCVATLLPVASTIRKLRHSTMPDVGEDLYDATELQPVIIIPSCTPDGTVETIPRPRNEARLQLYLWFYSVLAVYFYVIRLLVAIEGYMDYTTVWVCQALTIFVTWCFHVHCSVTLRLPALPEGTHVPVQQSA